MSSDRHANGLWGGAERTLGGETVMQPVLPATPAQVPSAYLCPTPSDASLTHAG
jgi:hypothetical protein